MVALALGAFSSLGVNPMLLSCAMMLDWLGERHRHRPAVDAARKLEQAVFAAYAAERVKPFEFGGSDGTVAITGAVIDMLSNS